MSWFQREDGLVHFVFANEDTYFCENMLRLNLTDYLYYELKKNRRNKIFFIRHSQGMFQVQTGDEMSRTFCEDQKRVGIGKLLGIFSVEESTAAAGRHTIEMNETQLVRLLKNAEKSAFVFRLNAFCALFDSDPAQLRALRDSTNLLLIQMGTLSSESMNILCAEDRIFQRERLVPDSGELRRTEDFYSCIKIYLGNRCVFLNSFSRESVKAVLQGVFWTQPEKDPEPERTAAYISQWFRSERLRERHRNVFSVNDRMKFSVLASDLENRWDLIRQRAQEWHAETETYPAERTVFVRDDSEMTRKLEAIRLPASFPGQYPAQTAQWKQLLLSFRVPRVTELTDDLRRDTADCIEIIREAVERQDMRTMEHGMACLRYGRRAGFRFSSGNEEIMNAFFEVTRLSRILWQQERQIQASKKRLDDWNAEMEEACQQVLFYSRDYQKDQPIEDYPYLYNEVKRAKYLESSIRTQKLLLSRHLNELNRCRELEHQLQMITDEEAPLNADKVSDLLREAIDKRRLIQKKDREEDSLLQESRRQIDESLAFHSEEILKKSYDDVLRRAKSNRPQEDETIDIVNDPIFEQQPVQRYRDTFDGELPDWDSV